MTMCYPGEPRPCSWPAMEAVLSTPTRVVEHGGDPVGVVITVVVVLLALLCIVTLVTARLLRSRRGAPVGNVG